MHLVGLILAVAFICFIIVYFFDPRLSVKLHCDIVVFESKRQRRIESDCGELPGNTAQ